MRWGGGKGESFYFHFFLTFVKNLMRIIFVKNVPKINLLRFGMGWLLCISVEFFEEDLKWLRLASSLLSVLLNFIF